MRGEPSAKNTGDDHTGKQSVNELPSPSRSPRLVQKLNEIQVNLMISGSGIPLEI